MLSELGVTEQDFTNVEDAPNAKAATSALDELKYKIRMGFKKLAFLYHPDKNPGDYHAEEKFRALTEIRDRIEKVVIASPAKDHVTIVTTYRWCDPRRRSPEVVRVVHKGLDPIKIANLRP